MEHMYIGLVGSLGNSFLNQGDLILFVWLLVEDQGLGLAAMVFVHF